ncbi:NfeD family protein [Candidatus Synechococcus calcipolaris G9]|uniref:NfeD family protein n=1 Tax=Candidatus Synechococcus calcipolaris G9 TaxID=1497997 RepID=A0ABT6EU80_9SYNE|nr:NfeD family protein [Candidatus Synechococcus calcipolaris]MDG2989446.1 NfeD family protein [Candidatus Synechococcus calcipolaris G9]
MAAVIDPFWLWIILGAVLCFLEVIFPTAFVEMMLGLSAFVIAFVSLLIPYFPLQVVLWLILAVMLIYVGRRFMPRRGDRLLQDAVEAETLTAIAPGGHGRVLYEGNSWQARCDDPYLEIPQSKKVFVLRREGTTLIIMPEDALGNRP